MKRFVIAVLIAVATVVFFQWAEAERGAQPTAETQQQVVQAFTQPTLVDTPNPVVVVPTPTPAQVETPTLAPVAVVDTPANWMEALLPQVDPSGYGHWIFERNGSWGATDSQSNVWIDPDMPLEYRYSVMIHEYAHVLQDRQYGGLDAARGVEDIESDADCYALAHGATWINYGCNR